MRNVTLNLLLFLHLLHGTVTKSPKDKTTKRKINKSKDLGEKALKYSRHANTAPVLSTCNEDVADWSAPSSDQTLVRRWGAGLKTGQVRRWGMWSEVGARSKDGASIFFTSDSIFKILDNLLFK